MELNKYSKTITQDPTQPAAQAMFYGIGLTDEDLKKAQVGIASMGWDGNTCNMHLNDLAAVVKKSVWETNLVGLIFNTIGVSDAWRWLVLTDHPSWFMEVRLLRDIIKVKI